MIQCYPGNERRRILSLRAKVTIVNGSNPRFVAFYPENIVVVSPHVKEDELTGLSGFHESIEEDELPLAGAVLKSQDVTIC